MVLYTNICPHKQAFVLLQGILGDSAGNLKVACPLHKKQFALETGDEINGGDLQTITFPIEVPSSSSESRSILPGHNSTLHLRDQYSV